MQLGTFVAVLLSVWCAKAQNCNFDNGYTHSSKKFGRKVHLKQGPVQGVIIEPRSNHDLLSVEQYLGIPYAAPPTGELRFMPSGSAPAWTAVKCADMMGPVCPQKLPDINTMDPARKDYFTRLLKHLQNQSEDCLYLNIYVPIQDDNPSRYSKYPVMVFIHGESFEWSSGNPYDGSVLAAYGKVIVVTINYRLGILGFLKVGLQEHARSNFGLVDQVAALVWVQENIQQFGGDPNSITLFGQGTGAACISLLMLSPMVPKEGKQLFHRAILMSGTALSDWALASTSRQVTYQVAEALNCPSDDKLAACLRRKRLNEIMDVVGTTTTSEYMTKFGPIVDGLVIPNDPAKIMSAYSDFFKRFEMMYGVTEVESVQLLSPVGLNLGLLEKERDHELRKYLYARCEYRPEHCVARTLAEYASNETMRDDKASLARDVLLDVLSDARTVAPLTLTARLHAALNPQSYFYVFGHPTASREFIRNKTTFGEELPYVFGVPLDGPKFHFTDYYNPHEKLFSEVVMTMWTNFAYSGDPNVPTKRSYSSLTPLDWKLYDMDWPEFDSKNERYLYLGIPPHVSDHYRHRQVQFWNEVLPSMLNNNASSDLYSKSSKAAPISPPLIFARPSPKNIPVWFPYGTPSSDKFPRRLPDKRPNDDIAYGKVKLQPPEKPPKSSTSTTGILNEFGTVVVSPSSNLKTGGTAMLVLVVVGGVFLLINIVLFVALYYKCSKLKTREEIQKRIYGDVSDVREHLSDKFDDERTNGCGIMKIISKSSRSEDTYEAVKVSESGCGGGSYKLSRQMSASTIDPHTKVRDWIAHEIVQRCSPKFLRKAAKSGELHTATINSAQKLLKGSHHALDTQHVRSESKTTESYSTLGKSPTRPVTPVDVLPVKAQKVSVAIDATPAARSPSILRQQPIELTKSLDYSSPPSDEVDCVIGLKRSATESNLTQVQDEATIVRIEHHRGGEMSGQGGTRKLKSFDPDIDVNVTSRDEEDDCVPPLTTEESLQTIKRRNFPKVLPDYPGRQNLMTQKRRSMPVASPLFMPIPENPSLSQPNSPNRFGAGCKYPPAPPPRASTLGRKPTNMAPIIQASPVKLAEEPPRPVEPEITCNNLYVGPLIPKDNKDSNSYLDMQPIYDNLRIITQCTSEMLEEARATKAAKTIITADPECPIKKVDTRVIIKPTTPRFAGVEKTRLGIPRVILKDNALPSSGEQRVDNDNAAEASGSSVPSSTLNNTGSIVTPKPCRKIEPESLPVDSATACNDLANNATSDDKTAASGRVKTPSQIPKLIKNSNSNLSKESSSESSPSEESETGTVIKRI